MADTFEEFETRLRRIGRKRAKLANGYTSVVGQDGLIIVKPRRARRGVPLKGLSLLVCGFFGFKGLLLGHLGTDTYNDRLTRLSSGTPIEQAGAAALAPDAVSAWVATQVGPYLH